ncbi:MAG: MiaB/RimO family radical SAM methylthiotransferase, partial [Clostridia bacterium]|nr:MiaB/RimO family radical SAM methylthiotransferase [Clostridia bacterium]
MKYIINYENKIKKILNAKIYKYYIDTMGCALNENDSMKYSGILSKMGFEKAYSIEDANIVIFNTCSIRENAEKTLYGRIGALKNKKKTDKNFYICVVGCMSQQKHVIEKIKESYSYVDIVLGTHSMPSFAKSFYEVLSLNKKIVKHVEDKDELTEDIPIIYDEGVKASVSIIYGCNNFCTYCIVPYVRGREKSRKPEDILKDIRDLAKQGYKEITLLGQNVNSYGNDFKGNAYNFVNLLRDVESIEGIDVIKFISPHPKDFSDELIKYISISKKVSKQIHLPIQSGSSKILKLMGRKYTKEQYLRLVDK